jgi:hypothetical protein
LQSHSRMKSRTQLPQLRMSNRQCALAVMTTKLRNDSTGVLKL